MNEENCCLCQKALHKFMTTPVLSLPDNTLRHMCESCADKEFPGWDAEEFHCEFGGTVRYITSDGRNVNMTDELNRLEKDQTEIQLDADK